ncbi:MAG: glutathione peroxidase [Peptoniphilaceae bacterium]|nr:glutathione peroxidase [Peptoniphilaceae bacterium]MDY6018629.1 glutathione peroxidase [Anaerococcus sp.]
MTVYDYSIKDANNNEVSLKDYEGKVLMIVNTATECGFTPQYEEIENIYEDLKDQGFEVIDIPCNQFGGQAPGTEEEIHSFCQLHFNTKFEPFKKSDVNGENELALYTYLKEQKGFKGFQDHPIRPILEEMFDKEDPAWRDKDDIKWNFTKFIIDRKGNVVERFEPTADLNEVKDCIKSLL